MERDKTIISPLDTPLTLDLCQHIYITALKQTLSGSHLSDELPPSLDRSVLQKRRKLFGLESCLLHPDMLQDCFRCITLEVYLLIEQLYCSRCERQIKTVWLLLTKRAQQNHTEAPTYEAIWAICIYLHKRRLEKTLVIAERIESIWRIVFLKGIPSANRQDEEENTDSGLICLFDEATALVLAFRMASGHALEAQTHLVFYDALISRRIPMPRAPAGLVWQIPKQILVDTQLPFAVMQIAQQFTLSIEWQEPPEWIIPIQAFWMREVLMRAIPLHRWEAVFDSYLHKTTGYSPFRIREQRDETYRFLKGYNCDPTWAFPALRELLACSTATIISNGLIEYDGQTYSHPFLRYWSGATVTIRPSGTAVWVYLEESVLCRAVHASFSQDVEEER